MLKIMLKPDAHYVLLALTANKTPITMKGTICYAIDVSI